MSLLSDQSRITKLENGRGAWGEILSMLILQGAWSFMDI
jgi:hypothetical protein